MKEQELSIILKCQFCNKNDGTSELHVCPYKSEINDNEEDLCNCCEDCQHECAMDI